MKDYSVLDKLVPQTEKLHRAIFDEGYTQGYTDGEDNTCKNLVSVQDAYQQGLKDAWNAAHKVLWYGNKEMMPLFGLTFGSGDWEQIFTDHTASEAIEKIKAYEEKQNEQEITVGDVVDAPGFDAPVVVIASYTDDSVRVMNSFGDTKVHPKRNVTKTGRHLPEILEVFKAMENEE